MVATYLMNVVHPLQQTQVQHQSQFLWQCSLAAGRNETHFEAYTLLMPFLRDTVYEKQALYILSHLQGAILLQPEPWKWQNKMFLIKIKQFLQLKNNKNLLTKNRLSLEEQTTLSLNLEAIRLHVLKLSSHFRSKKYS